MVILNDETFEEETSFSLSRLNIYMVLSGIFVVMLILVISLVAFTPLKAYIAGADSAYLKKTIIDQRMQIDSLFKDKETKDLYINVIRNIVNGDVDSNYQNSSGSEVLYDSIEFDKNYPNDSIFRAQMEREEVYALGLKEIRNAKNYFFAPIKGLVTNEYDPEQSHLGIDIVAPEKTMIKSVLSGTVIFTEKTLDTGWVIAIQHENGYVSFYKHNSVLLKKSGNFVRAGDVIAVIGNTGELTTGPHLHFELWYKGSPVDPREYIIFE